MGQMQDDHILISVADEGWGIPTGQIAYIFDAFYRVPAPEVRQVRGAGLGLTVCRAIVEAHGGNLWAESTPGKGSVFSFTLSLRDGAA